MAEESVRQNLVALLGESGVLDRAEDLALYEYDGGVDKRRPDLVAFPRTTEQVTGIVRIARQFDLPLVEPCRHRTFPAARFLAKAESW